MPKVIDLTDQVFGRLTVLYRTDRRPRAWWMCQCVCGNKVEVPASGLKCGDYVSCGCYIAEMAGQHCVKHGHAREGKMSDTYSIWRSMRSRCNDPKFPKYENYGGRGIKVCDRWNCSDCYPNFLEDMGEKPFPDAQLDRIDNTGPYCKENCRWTTRHTQSRNKTNNKWITYDGRTKILTDWGIEFGIDPGVLYYRIFYAKWNLHAAFHEPVNHHKKSPPEYTDRLL